MAKNDNTAAWVVGGIAALAVLAMASSSREPVRRTFHDELNDALSERGFRLIAAELGRLHGRSVWVVTCEGRDGRLYRTQVGVDDPAYDKAIPVADAVAATLATA